jgi:4'-phosphopantetheinyl transferase
MRGRFNLLGPGNTVSWPPPDLPLLKDDEVHVWLASLEVSPHEVGKLAKLITEDELEKAGRFHFQTDRDHFIVVRGMLRSILGKYLKMDPDKLTFYCGPYGKPMLAERTNPDMVRFNISHSHGLALCVVAKREVGVDLEFIHEDYSFEGIVEQFFSQKEVDALNSCPEHLRVSLFFQLWTRKEAYLKAQGLGLSGDLKQPEVFSVIQSSGEFRSSQAKSPWVLMDLAVPPGYAAAVAVKGHNLRFKYWQWDKDIMQWKGALQHDSQS